MAALPVVAILGWRWITGTDASDSELAFRLLIFARLVEYAINLNASRRAAIADKN